MRDGSEVNIRTLKANATTIIRRVEAGERITVTKRGRTVAVFVPVSEASRSSRTPSDSAYQALRRQIVARVPGLRRASPLDSSLFIVDRFFRQDTLYPANRAFLERLAEIDGNVPLLTLMELCGAASFRLAPREIERWLHDFAAVYRVHVVNPSAPGRSPPRHGWKRSSTI